MFRCPHGVWPCASARTNPHACGLINLDVVMHTPQALGNRVRQEAERAEQHQQEREAERQRLAETFEVRCSPALIACIAC